jgi:hypothetical protein
VARDEEFTNTLDDELKFVPLTVTFCAALPSGTVTGETPLGAGTGLFTVNVVTIEGLLPGFVTVTKGVPATAMALAGMDADNCVALI